MSWLRGAVQVVIYVFGVGAVLGGIAYAIRRVMISQGQIVQAWVTRRLRRYTSWKIARGLVMREYGERLLDRDDLRFLVVPGQEAQIALPIESAFIPLRLLQDTATHSGANLIHAGGPARLFVVGEPGSGKSSLLKREVIKLAGQMRSRAKTARVPVFLRLGQVATGIDLDQPDRTESLLDIVRRMALAGGPAELESLWPDLLSDGRLVVLLDGLDEVPLPKLNIVVSMILQLCQSLDAMNPSCAVVVSTRPQALKYVSKDLTEAIPTQLIVERFNMSDIYEFLTRWPFHRSSNSVDPRRVFENIGSNPQLKQLCQTPLLLAMYCALISRSADYYDVPSRRTEFYERVILELLRRRQRSEDRPSEVRFAKWVKLAEEIAYLHLLASSDARNQVSRSTIESAKATLTSSALGANDMFEEFLVNTGLLREERAGETYYFMHLSFAEYLAARRVAGEAGHGDTVEVALLGSAVADQGRAVDSSTRAIVLFISPMIPEDARRRLLDMPEIRGDLVTVLRAFVESNDVEHERFLEALGEAKERLRGPAEPATYIEWVLDFSDIWLQLRPAVEAGDLDRRYDLSSDLDGILSRTDSTDRPAMLRLIARSDEYTAMTILRQMKFSVKDYPEAFVQLMSVPAFLDEFQSANQQNSPTQSTLQDLVMLEAALASRKVAETLASQFVMWEKRPRPHPLFRVLPSYEFDSNLVQLCNRAPALVTSVPSDDFEAPIARSLAEIMTSTRRWRAFSMRVWLRYLLPVPFVFALAWSMRRGSLLHGTGWLAVTVVTLLIGLSQASTLRAVTARQMARRLVGILLNLDRRFMGDGDDETVPPLVGTRFIFMYRRPFLGSSLVRKAFPGLIETLSRTNRLPTYLARSWEGPVKGG